MDQQLDWVNRYWRLLSFVAWLILATLVVFADGRYSKADAAIAEHHALELRIERLELQYQVIATQLSAISSNQNRILNRLEVP